MSCAPGNEQSGHTAAGGDECVLDRLQELLQKQLELVHQGGLAAAMKLCEQTDQCVQEIVDTRARAPTCNPPQTGSPADVPGSADQWQRIGRLYKELCLTLAAQRTEASAALNAVRRGKRMLRTYGSYLSSI